MHRLATVRPRSSGLIQRLGSSQRSIAKERFLSTTKWSRATPFSARVYDALDLSSFSTDELATAFDTLDVNGDKVIERDEVRAVLLKRKSESESDAFVDEFMRRFDDDDDGSRFFFRPRDALRLVFLVVYRSHNPSHTFFPNQKSPANASITSFSTWPTPSTNECGPSPRRCF